MKADGYNPMDYYNTHEELRNILDRLGMGYFSPGDKDLFKPLVDSLKYHDEYMLLADYQSYSDCQEKVSQAYKDKEHWTTMSILNVARSGKFSSDRTIKEYCDDIWKVKPVKVELQAYDPAKAVLNVNG